MKGEIKLWIPSFLPVLSVWRYKVCNYNGNEKRDKAAKTPYQDVVNPGEVGKEMEPNILCGYRIKAVYEVRSIQFLYPEVKYS